MSPMKVNVKGKVKLTINVKVKVVECIAIEEWQSAVEECICQPTVW